MTPLLAYAIATLATSDSLPCEVRGSHEWLATRASPLDSIALRVGTTTAKICYSRPHARGRSVYDSLAPFGIAWRTGANEPTTLRLDGPAVIGGVQLAAGRYVLLAVPQRTQWLIVFHTAKGTEAGEMFRTLTVVGTGTAVVEPLATRVEQFTIRSTGGPGDAAFLFEWGLLRARLSVRPGSL